MTPKTTNNAKKCLKKPVKENSNPVKSKKKVKAKPKHIVQDHAGKPRKFKDRDAFMKVYLEFLFEIIQGDFCYMPTQMRFCLWYEQRYGDLDRKTVYNTTNKYFPNLKKEVGNILSDILIDGAGQGKFNPTIIIFTLKNWCGWKDKYDVDVNEEMLSKLDDVLEKIK